MPHEEVRPITQQDAENRPHPDHEAKPDKLTEITKPSWRHVAKRVAYEVGDDHLPDLAAALTYFAVLSVFPALIALVSLLGLVGDAQGTITTLMDLMRRFVPADAMDQLQPIVAGLVNNRGAGFGLAAGLFVALWTASGYVTAFSRAMNRIYEVEEGRPFWKLRPIMYGLTALLLVLVAIGALLLVVSGPVAQAVGDVVGLGAGTVAIWEVAKWPVLLFIVILVIALLYYFTPNIRQPTFRWISAGAVVAIVVAIIASVLFGLYVANFSRYQGTYGALAGVIIFLLWVWLVNLALLVGAEVDAELERGRELQAGFDAEHEIQLPVDDDRKIEKKARKEEELVREGRQLRRTGGESER